MTRSTTGCAAPRSARSSEAARESGTRTWVSRSFTWNDGLAEVRALMREGGIPRRWWLLFFDAQWRDEWLGIHDDTPAPPRIPDGTEVTSSPS